MNITIIGSGNISHALIALLGSVNDVYVLSTSLIDVEYITAYSDTDELLSSGKIKKITDNPALIIPISDIIIFTVPSFLRKKNLELISQYVSNNTLIGSFPGTGGFELLTKTYIKNKKINIFSSQRVPFIARIMNRGMSVKVSLKETMEIAVLRNKFAVKDLFQNLFNMNVIVLNDFLEVNLSNSNPILHSARLYSLFYQYSCDNGYSKEIYFYREWNDFASEILLNADEEFMSIVKKLNLTNVKSLKEYYEVNTAEEMTKKIISIEAFKDIKTPMIKIKDVYHPDFNSRYFIEDILYGLKFIRDYAQKLDIKIVTIDRIFNWAMKHIDNEKKY